MTGTGWSNTSVYVDRAFTQVRGEPSDPIRIWRQPGTFFFQIAGLGQVTLLRWIYPRKDITPRQSKEYLTSKTPSSSEKKTNISQNLSVLICAPVTFIGYVTGIFSHCPAGVMLLGWRVSGVARWQDGNSLVLPSDSYGKAAHAR